MTVELLDELAKLLAAAGVATYSPDAPLPDGAVVLSIAGSPPTPGAAVTLTLYPGPEPDSRNGWQYPRLQVRVRHPDNGQALALDGDAYRVLQPLSVDLADGTHLSGYCLQSAPMPMGQDPSGRHEFTRNYQLTLD